MKSNILNVFIKPVNDSSTENEPIEPCSLCDTFSSLHAFFKSVVNPQPLQPAQPSQTSPKQKDARK